MKAAPSRRSRCASRAVLDMQRVGSKGAFFGYLLTISKRGVFVDFEFKNRMAPDNGGDLLHK